jgi:hypothetical protein
VSVVLVDDHVLLRILLADEPPSLRPPGTAIATTGLWYHRLCRALADQAVLGSLSRRLGAVGSDVAQRVMESVITLPDTVTLVSLRTLGWPMAELVHSGARLNLLSLEALAAARVLSAPIVLAEQDANPPLRDAARRLGIPLRILRD